MFAKLSLHRVYFCLAAFDLLLLATSLWVTHSNQQVFGLAIDNNKHFVTLQSKVENFSAAAARTNAPGNDVFDSHNPKMERTNLNKYLGEYTTTKESLETDLKNEDRSLLPYFEASTIAMSEMLLEAETIFSAFEKNKPQFAASRMATMDRKFAILNDRIRELRQAVVQSHRKALHAQGEQLSALALYEKVLAAILGLLTFVVVIYGQKLKTKISGQQNTIQDQEYKILDSQKLASLGSVASAVVHEINNPLAVLKMRVNAIEETLNEKKLADDFTKDAFASCNKMIDRIGIIIRGVKTLSHGGSDADKMEIIKFKELLNEVVALVQGRIKEFGITLKVSPFDDFDIEVSPVQISQILINLINNASDAISALDVRLIQLNFVQTATHVQIFITDSGTGIAADVVDKLFTPFHTTKARGKGTGIGLSISRKIAESHHGTLIYSASSPSTQFVVTLPLRQPAKTTVAADSNTPPTNLAA
jgi:C4-dicarboxylate-specific signal transduction histidine kinase